MATITLDIPTNRVARVRAMVEALGPQLIPEQVPEGDPNSWTNVQALAVYKAMLVRFTTDLVKQVEAEAAAQAARDAAIAQVDADGLVS